MNEPQRTQQTVAGLLLLCFLLYFWELGQIPFYNYEESKEALIVWEMVNDGGWVLPLRNGTEIPLKPPLFHWCGALIAWISGKANEFAVRSPSAFFSTGSVLMIFFFLLLPVNGHTRAEWLWLTLTGQGHIEGGGTGGGSPVRTAGPSKQFTGISVI